jgi:PKD repeat protein
MAIAFRSAGALAGGTSSSLTINYPAGVASGDLLVLQYAALAARTVTTPGGWTKLYGPVATAGTSPAISIYAYYRVAGASEPSSVSVALDSNGGAQGIISAYSGCDTTTPINTSATANLPTSGTSGTCPTVTTTVASTLLLHAYYDWTSSTTITPNASDTERYDSFLSTLNMVFELADKPQAAAGATGTSIATFGGATSGGGCATIALAPIAAASPPVADFTGIPTSGSAPLSVVFSDASTNTPTSWAWDFGDGATSTSQNPTHSYATSGVYTVQLTASNTAGSNTKTRTAYITVSEPIVYAPGSYAALRTSGGIDIY